jgi:hypothetical protein
VSPKQKFHVLEVVLFLCLLLVVLGYAAWMGISPDDLRLDSGK